MRLLFSATALIGTFFSPLRRPIRNSRSAPTPTSVAHVAADGPARLLKPLGGVKLLARREARPRPKHQIANKNCAGWVLVVRARRGA
jgi:hypothetical protein